MDSLATADFAFEAFGERPEELFESAALALESVIVNLDGVRGIKSRKLRIEGESLENLLFDFLSELIYLQSAEGLVFSSFDIKIDKNEDYNLEAECLGEKIDPEKHQLGTEVKGVTLHKFKVEKLSNGRFRCQVVLDV